MGQLVAILEKKELAKPAMQMLRMDVKRIRQLRQSYKMLCENLCISMAEFEQVFAFDQCESLFTLLDQDANGLIDSLEFFTILAIFSESRSEDRIRLLFELFDLNGREVLERIDLEFMFFTMIQGMVKLFQVESEGVDVENSVGFHEYHQLINIIDSEFPSGFMVNCDNLLQW